MISSILRCQGSLGGQAALSLILIVLCLIGHGQASVFCFSNAEEKQKSTTVDSIAISGRPGDDGFWKYSCDSVCYEAVKKSSAGENDLKYSSGCAACPSGWDCKSCSTPLCNNELYKKIKARHRKCYSAKQEASVGPGSKQIWCAENVATCFLVRFMYTTTLQELYNAGCGDPTEEQQFDHNGMRGLPAPCFGELCNLPRDDFTGQVIPVHIPRPHTGGVAKEAGGQSPPGKPGQSPPGKPGQSPPGKPGQSQPGKPGQSLPGKDSKAAAIANARSFSDSEDAEENGQDGAIGTPVAGPAVVAAAAAVALLSAGW